jgi:hypothetical protein
LDVCSALKIGAGAFAVSTMTGAVAVGGCEPRTSSRIITGAIGFDAAIWEDGVVVEIGVFTGATSLRDADLPTTTGVSVESFSSDFTVPEVRVAARDRVSNLCTDASTGALRDSGFACGMDG